MKDAHLLTSYFITYLCRQRQRRNGDYYEGGGNVRIYGDADWTGEQDVINATMEVAGDQYRLRFTGVEDGIDYDIIGIFESMVMDGVKSIKILSYNGLDCSNEENAGYYVTETEGGINAGSKISFIHSNGTVIYNDMNINLIEITELVVHQISTPFTGTAESDTGSYTLALAGYYTAELTDGTHVLSASDITSQTIAIVAYNKANGVKRVMRETTIEEMTVTVSGGVVTEYIIRGRVQTDGGTLDRYTATINP